MQDILLAGIEGVTEYKVEGVGNTTYTIGNWILDFSISCILQTVLIQLATVSVMSEDYGMYYVRSYAEEMD